MSVAAVLGLASCGQTGRVVGLPLLWQAVVWVAGSILLWHAAPLVTHAAYFERFVETAALSDGVWCLLIGTWGLWAARQVPLVWLRRLRWAGGIMIAANLVAWLGGRPNGLLGIDRLLGAYALLWLPILATWKWWLVPLPLALLVVSGKPTMWIALAAMATCWQPRRWWWTVPLALAIALVIAEWHVLALGHPSTFSRLLQRWETWAPTFQATFAHPFVGWGFSPMAFSSMQQTYHARLPSIHSDWLSVAFHAGWIVCAVAGWAWWTIIRTVARTRWQRAIQASLCGIGVLAFGHSVVSHARIAGIVLLLLAWWWAESEQPKECG